MPPCFQHPPTPPLFYGVKPQSPPTTALPPYGRTTRGLATSVASASAASLGASGRREAPKCLLGDGVEAGGAGDIWVMDNGRRPSQSLDTMDRFEGFHGALKEST
jgi:hypothetical protein